MARRRGLLGQVRRDLYFAQRGIGDYQAAQRGPGVLVPRVVRRGVTRSFFRALRTGRRL